MMPVRRLGSALALGLALGSAHCGDESWVCEGDESLEMYQRRIAPLMSGEHQSSCNECHLSGVDLGIYAQADPCATMACMVEKGIVDLDNPTDSVVLDWIDRADPASELITADVIQAERDAMLEWIEYNAQCGASVCGPIENPCGDNGVGSCDLPLSNPGSGSREFEDPGDCLDTTIEAGFAALVYSWRGRCQPCHFDSYDNADLESPRWISDASCDVGSLQTMRNVLERGLVDRTDPAQSLLLLKPLAEAEGGVMHGGHDKFADKDDPAYQDMLAWIELWSACQP